MRLERRAGRFSRLSTGFFTGFFTTFFTGFFTAFLVALSGALLLGPALHATEEPTTATAVDPLESELGFFDFESQKLFERDDLEIHISVKGPLLQLVAAASKESEPELADILRRLKGIEVRVYNLREPKRQAAEDLIVSLAGRLEREGWRSAITVQVQRDHGYAFLRYRDGETDPEGLAALYLTDGNQAVFVNIVGSMNTAAIGSLARRFDLDLLAVEEP